LGKAITVAPVDSKGQRARASRVIKWQPRREISFQIEDIKLALNLAENPDNPDRSRLTNIYKYIFKDGHLISQVRTAKNAVKCEPYMLYGDDGKPNEAATKLIRQIWFNSIIEYALESEFIGHRLIEADDLVPGDKTKGSITPIDPLYVSPERQWILIEGTVNGSYLPYAEFKNEMDLMEFGKRNDFGIYLQCAYNVIWKYYSRSDWSRGSEKFGMPILSIEADTNNDSELDAIESRAANFGADGYIVTQKGDTVQIIERAGQQMHLIWKDNISLCNDEVSKIINGQTATSDEKSFTGAAQVQERTMDDFTMSRLQNIADEVNQNVIPYLIYKGFPLTGLTFDYPRVVSERERRIKGQPLATDAEPEPNEAKNDPDNDPQQDDTPTPNPAKQPAKNVLPRKKKK